MFHYEEYICSTLLHREKIIELICIAKLKFSYVNAELEFDFFNKLMEMQIFLLKIQQKIQARQGKLRTLSNFFPYFDNLKLNFHII